jgi:hypothetical protein
MEDHQHWGDEDGFTPTMVRQRSLAIEPGRRARVRPGPRFDVHAPPAHGSRVLLVCALGTNPRDIMVTRRMLGIARASFETAHVQTEVLNLTLATAALAEWRGLDDGEAAVATRPPWARETPADSTAAHGVLILMPEHWRRTSSALKLLINRSASQAAGSSPPGEPVWPHEPAREARAYGLVTHGDLRFASRARQALCEWLDWMCLVESCEQAHWHHIESDDGPADGLQPVPGHALPLEWEVRSATAALLRALAEIEAGRLNAPEHLLMRAWPR